MAAGLRALSNALAFRLRNVARALDRLDRLEAGTGAWLTDQSDSKLESAATEITLRVFRVAADPTGFALLNQLTGHATIMMSELEGVSGLDRLSLSERVNDLIQVGLASREIDTDHVQITEAGAALTSLLNEVRKETQHHLGDYLSPATTLE